MIASEDLKVLRDLTDVLTSDASYLIDQTKEWEYAFDAMPDCVFVINLEYKMRFVNKIMCERLNRQRDDLIDKACYDILKCTDRQCQLKYSVEETQECVESANDIGEFYIGELNGWFKFTRSPILDHHKNILGFICVLRDITERKKEEELRLQSEKKFSLAFQTSMDSINFNRLSDGMYIEVNEGFVKLSGYTREEAIGKTSLELRLWHDRNDREKLLENLRRDGYVENFEAKFRKKDGEIIIGLMSASILTIDGEEVILSTTRDITERCYAKIELEKREAMLQSVFRTMPAGTGVISSPDRKIVLVNETLCHMVGYTREELEGQSARILYESDAEFMRVGIEKYAQVEKYGLGEVETRFKKKDGSFIDIRLRTTPIGNNEIFGCVAFNFTATDITNFKAAAAKIQRDKERLEALLKLSEIDDEDKIVSQALEEAVKFTQSDIGYFHFIEADEIHLTLFKWSKKVLESGMCTAEKTSHYPLTEAGIWADCIRIRKPVVHNDYEKYPYKKGLPEGHARLTRHMSVPIFLDEKVVGIMGVGNKKEDYTDYDVTQVSLFAQHMIDIVKRLRAEKDKLLSEAKYRQLYEVTPTGVYEVDFRTMKITYVNDAMCEYTGYPRKELIGMNPLDLLGPNSKIKFMERLAKMKAGEIVSPYAEFRVVRKDGNRIWVKISATYKFDFKGVTGATVVAVDITKEKQQIEALRSARDESRAANELLSTIYEFLPAVAVLTTTDDYIIKDVNKKFTEVTGWTKEEAVGKTTLDLNLWVDLRQRTDIRRMLEQSNYSVDNVISEFKDRNGKRLKGLTSVRRFTCGEEDCILAITRDITNIIDEICTDENINSRG